MDRDRDSIREQAERWFARRRDGVRPAAEEAEFERWRQSSQAHASAYAACERAWEELGGLRASTRMQEIAAAAMRATAPSRRRPSAWRPLLIAAALGAVALVGVWRLLPAPSPPPATLYRTAVGEQRMEQLADGSRLTLNTDTALRVRYGRARREIQLEQGEALFDVAHEPQRPFTVAAADGVVTALGTRFQVRAEQGGAVAVTVTLLEGKVEITRQTRQERQVLAPGDRAEFIAADMGIVLSQVDLAAATAWTQGRLDFRATPLREAVTEANRYTAVKLRLGDPALATLPVSGNFRVGDNAAIAGALTAVFPVRIASRSANEIVLEPR